jgi:hypothetical protein
MGLEEIAMGGIARMNRSERFIKEFGELAKSMYAPGPEGQKVFPNWNIAFDSSSETVQLYWSNTLDGVERSFIADSFPVFFNPDEDDDDAIERVMDLFELKRDVAIERLKRSDLIYADHFDDEAEMERLRRVVEATKVLRGRDNP